MQSEQNKLNRASWFLLIGSLIMIAPIVLGIVVFLFGIYNYTMYPGQAGQGSGAGFILASISLIILIILLVICIIPLIGAIKIRNKKVSIWYNISFVFSLVLLIVGLILFLLSLSVFILIFEFGAVLSVLGSGAGLSDRLNRLVTGNKISANLSERKDPEPKGETDGIVD